MIAVVDVTPTWYLVLGAMLFTIGAVGLLVRRNPLVILLCLELMLNAVNLAFVAFSTQPGTEAKIFATALGAGILLDATIIRGVLAPAAVSILGRWNWWLPTWAARILRVEPSPLEPPNEPDTGGPKPARQAA